MNSDKTHLLIQRFFDATATKEEEEALRKILADPSTESTDEVNEARAVMGFTALFRPRLRRPASSRRLRAIAASAAAVAVAATIGLWAITHQTPSSASDATIYASGNISHSTDDALAIMTSQLSQMGQANASSQATRMLNALGESMHK
ncbi:MAG: hypothetical protein NC342_06735 [Pseudoflavonifractor sp.]|nr:hypothetical protein [Alloprevotella sp.]MCM1117213.1 hypothetical protein [Pseudoflavonifractor sp.]